MVKKLFVTFEGAGAEKGGVGVDCLTATLAAVQEAARITANDLAARGALNAAKPSKDAVDAQCAMRLVAIGGGSFAAELELESSSSAAGGGEYASRALDALLGWDGYEDSSLPVEAMRKLHGARGAIPMDTRVWLGDGENRRMAEITRVIHADNPASEPETALLYGWLKEVNWAKRTAQLYRYADNGYIRLRFSESLDGEMVRLATRLVKVKGVGNFNDAGDWSSVRVDGIELAGTVGKPFDMDAFRNNPNPKIFRVEDIVTASEPFDAEAFIRSIKEGRKA